MSKSQISPKQMYVDAKVAAEIGKALGVDLIIVGYVSNPRMKEEFDSTPYYDMSQQAGISGTTKYTLLKQEATIGVSMKAVDVKTSSVVWNVDNLKGYIKYIKAFQSGTPRGAMKAVPEDVVRADIRKHLMARVTHVIAPDIFAERKIPEYLRKPSDQGLELVRSGGKPLTF